MTSDLRDLLQREAQRVHPDHAPVDSVVAQGYARLRRRRLATAALASVVAVVVGVTTLGLVNRDQQGGDSPADVKPSDSSWGPYRVGDRIFVGDTTITVKHLANRLVRVPGGVVYPTETGRIVFVTSEGDQKVIGHGAGSEPEPASDPTTGWVAWFERGKHGGEIVLYDTTRGKMGAEIDRISVGYQGARDCSTARSGSYGPFAIDNGTVYYCTANGDYAWRPAADGDPHRIFPAAGSPGTADDYLLDVRNGVRVVLRDTGGSRPATVIEGADPNGRPVVIERSLIDGFLSLDGRYLAGLREPAMTVYDTATGQRLAMDGITSKDQTKLAMTFTDDGGVAYAVINITNGRSNIVTCTLPDGDCGTAQRDLRGGVFFANQRIQ
jgi:hypothetical protein